MPSICKSHRAWIQFLAVLFVGAYFLTQANNTQANNTQANSAVAATQQVSVTGVLNVQYGDPRPGSSGGDRVQYSLTDATGTSWSLNVPPGLAKSAKALDRRGAQVEGSAAGGRSLNVASLRGSGAPGASPAPALPLSGSQRWATLLCRFAGDASEDQPLSFFDDMMSNTKPGANDYWREQSYGAINLDGSAQYNWVSLPNDRASYVDNQGANLDALAQDCATAQDAAVNFSNFSGINFIFNDDLDCCAWGGGTTVLTGEGLLGFKSTWLPPWAWSEGSGATFGHGVVGQEMGHGFGLPHEGCQGTTSPYDSDWDVQSSAQNSQIHTNAAFKDKLGWIPGARRYDATTADNQLVNLERLALPGNSGYLMVKIPLPGGKFYTIESRKFAGYDGSPHSIPSEAVVIHYVDFSLDKGAQVVVGDGSCNGTGGAWIPGEIFKDPANNISIAIVSEFTSGFTVAINPTADLAVTKTATPNPAMAGQQLTYDITVTNQGSGPAVGVVVTDNLPDAVTFVSSTAPCAPIGGGDPNDYTCTLASILAGASKTFSIVVDVPPGIVPGAGATTITNDVSVATDTPDTDLSNNSFSLTTTVVASADLRLLKECKPDQPNTQPAGTPTICEIYVDNLGPSDARNVVITDRVISGLAPVTITSITSTSTSGPPATCAPATPTAPSFGITITCSDTVLPAGARDTIKVEFVANDTTDVDDNASVTSDTPDPNTSNNAAVGRVSFFSSADVRLAKVDSPDPVLAGNNLTWTITVTNDGPSIALNVVMKDTLPAQVTDVSVSSAGNTCTAGVPGDALQPLSCNMGPIAAGASEVVTVVARVKPDTPDGTILFNQARVTADSPDPDNSNNNQSESTTVNAEANLALTKTDSPDPVVAGTTLKYELTVTNAGPSNALNVSLTDSLAPTAQVSFVSATVIAPATGTCVYNPLPNTVSCSFNGPLAVGPSWKVLIEVKVLANVPDGTNLANTATVTSTTTDPALANNTANAGTAVITRADLSVTKDGNFQTSGSSTNVVYRITVTNNGPSDALSVQAVDTLPSTYKKFVFVFVSDPACSYSQATHKVTCNFGTLAAGASRTVDITMNPKGNLGNITNTVTVTTTTVDPVAANNTATKTMLVKGGS